MTEQARGCILILSHCASDRLEKLTWIQDIPEDRLDYVIIHADPALEKDYVYSPDTHVCTLRCPDDYLNLCIKVKLSMNFILTEFDPSFVVKIDDDMIVNIPRLMMYIDSPDHCDYEGVTTYNYNFIYCGGPLYYLNRTALNFVINMKTHGFTYQEDACVGRCLKQNQCSTRHVSTYTGVFDELTTAIAYHDGLRIFFSGESAGETLSDHAKRVSYDAASDDIVDITPKPIQKRYSILSIMHGHSR
uniref:Hexosyltransferase n=1 Tax=viral metagenome TaxID=1070528 RepID=A0A6C0AJA3_9ZZZZ